MQVRLLSIWSAKQKSFKSTDHKIKKKKIPNQIRKVLQLIIKSEST